MNEPAESWREADWPSPELRGPNARAAALILLAVFTAGLFFAILFVALHVLYDT